MVPIRCLIVDDHAAVRVGLAEMLREDQKFEVLAAVSSAEEAVAFAERNLVDVAIVDYSLGGRSGLWASRKMKRLPHPPAVLIYSAFADGALAAACVVAEADGLVGKSRVDVELCGAVCDVAQGMTRLPLLPPSLAESMRQRLDSDEQAVFGMRSAGISNPQIAEILGWSRGELESRLWGMLRKLELVHVLG
jgi:DNA-binding NarL/FixJ family response regulator